MRPTQQVFAALNWSRGVLYVSFDTCKFFKIFSKLLTLIFSNFNSKFLWILFGWQRHYELESSKFTLRWPQHIIKLLKQVIQKVSKFKNPNYAIAFKHVLNLTNKWGINWFSNAIFWSCSKKVQNFFQMAPNWLFFSVNWKITQRQRASLLNVVYDAF